MGPDEKPKLTDQIITSPYFKITSGNLNFHFVTRDQNIQQSSFMRNIDSFYLNLDEPVKSCLEALRTIILKHDSQITESIKYGMPFFSIHRKMICYFWKDKKNGLPYIGFKEAKSLPFPWLEIGDRSTISVMYIDPRADIPLKKLSQTLKAAIAIIELKTNKITEPGKTLK